MIALAPNIEKILKRLASGKARTTLDTLITAASGDAVRLADTLWSLVRDGKGGLVGHERAVISMLAPGTFDAQDFLALLRQLNGANLFWYQLWNDRVEGLAYHGWSKELEELLDKLLETATDRTPLEWADVAEPAGSALLFALGRRSIVEAHVLPPDALHRFGSAFLWQGSWSPEQFAGWERLWNNATFARALFGCVTEVKNVGVFSKALAPLIEYATPSQLVSLVEKMVWHDHQAIDWLTARGKAVVPHLEARMERLLKEAKNGQWISDGAGLNIGALARIRAQNKEVWPAKWTPLVKSMLTQDTAGLRDVLSVADEKTRDDLLLAHLSNDENWPHKLWPLTVCPTQRLVDGIVALIRKTPKANDWDDERVPLFKTLGGMGEKGQTALETLLDEKDQTVGAITNLMATKEHLARTIEYLRSSNDTIAKSAKKLWFDIADDDRIEQLERHFDVMPQAFIAELLGYTQYDLRVVELAKRLPDTAETHAWRRVCLFPPEELRPVVEAMAKTPRDAIERARQALAPEFAANPDHRYSLTEALATFGPDDLPAILHVTACRLNHRQVTMRQLCKHFWPARPEIPWIAAFWWGVESGSTLAGAAEALGEAFLPALRARAKSGTISDGQWFDVLQIFVKYDPVTDFEFFTPFAYPGYMLPHARRGVIAALEKGSAPAREWLARALMGKEREFALHVLSECAVREVLPILHALEKQKLTAKLTKLLRAAIVAQRMRGSTIQESTKALSARIIHKVSGSVKSLRLSRDGQTLVAHAAGTATVWNGSRESTIGNLGNVAVDLSLDGRFVLVTGESNVNVIDPWESLDEPRLTLKSNKGVGLVVPMPGGRAFTLCAAPNASSTLTLWEIETGQEKEHKLNGLPAHAAWIDDKRYVVATIDEKMTIRQLDDGKVTGKLQSWAGYNGGGICMVASGNAGKLVAVLFFDGTLMIWDVSGSRIKALGRHARIAPRALVMDPDSSWVVTPGTNEVLTWKEGQPARAILGAGPPAVRRANPFADTGLAVFVRANVVAVGGESVNVWDLETSRHMGRWDKPITTMVSALGKLFVGDTEGNIWEVDIT